MDIFDLAERRLAWIDQRQALLARNVANADTPGFRSRDLKPFAQALADTAHAPPLAVTSPLHLAGRADSSAQARQSGGWERAPDGNAVVLDRELAKIADTEGAQDMTVGLYEKYASMFRTALGR